MTSKFERKYGRHAINNLTLYLIIGYIVGYAISWINPDMYNLLTFDPYCIFHGQIWRVITWVVTAPSQLDIFTIIMLMLYYSLGTSLERTWGAYRYNVYLFSGFLFTIIGALAAYGGMCMFYGFEMAPYLGQMIRSIVSTYYINMSIFLAFAVTYPDMQLMLYFIIPVKVKWFGILYAVFIGIDIINVFKYADTKEGMVQAVCVTVVIIMSLLNFIIYFFRIKSKSGYNPKQVKRKREYHQSVNRARSENIYSDGARHKCVICGRTDLSNPELTFRYCSKCSGSKEYCQDHLFTHTHS